MPRRNHAPKISPGRDPAWETGAENPKRPETSRRKMLWDAGMDRRRSLETPARAPGALDHAESAAGGLEPAVDSSLRGLLPNFDIFGRIWDSAAGGDRAGRATLPAVESGLSRSRDRVRISHMRTFLPCVFKNRKPLPMRFTRHRNNRQIPHIILSKTVRINT
jgi:hypothetical protein